MLAPFRPREDERRGGTNGKADLIFVSGEVYTVDAARSWARAVAVRGGRSSPSAPMTTSRAIGSAHRGGRPRRTMLLPGFQDAHVHPVGGGLEMLQCDLNELSTRRVRADRSDYAEDDPDAVDPGRRLGDGRVPGRHAAKEPLDARRARPTVVPPEPRRPQRVGQLPGARARRASRATPPTRPTDASSATPTASPPAPCTRARCPSSTASARATDEDWPTGSSRAQHVPPFAGHHRVAGRDRRTTDENFGAFRRYLEAAGRATSPPAWSARCGGTATAGPSRSRGSSTLRERGRVGRFAPTSVKIMQDGVLRELHGRRPRAVPRRPRRRDREPRDLLRRPRGAEGRSPARRLGFQVHFHAIAERAVREALDAIEAALIANGPSDNRHHLAHIQVVHPDDIPRFRRLGAVANAQPLWAAHEPQMDELTIPFLGEPRWRGSTRSRAWCAPARCSRWAATGPSPARTRSRRCTSR